MRAVSTGRTLLLSALLGGCAVVGPDYRAPVPPAASPFSQPLPGSGQADDGELALWWRQFDDPLLDRLITQALVANHDLRSAADRVREARALAIMAGAPALPQLTAAGGVQRQRRSENALMPLPPGRNPTDAYRMGLDLTWELDVFGRIARQAEAAGAELEAAAADAHAVRVALAAELARQYTELRSLDARIEVAARSAEIAQEMLELTRARATAGLTSELDVLRTQELLHLARAQGLQLAAARRGAELRIGVLLGRSAPLHVAAEPEWSPSVQPRLPEVLPPELLTRRPDLRRAERQVAAASARIGVAIADLYPRFSLTGAFGTEALRSGDLSASGSRFWSIGPSVIWPLLSGGRLRAAVEVADARLSQAMARYERSILIALEEIEQATEGYVRSRARSERLRAAEGAAAGAIELARQRYAQGLSDFLAVLDAIRQRFAVADQRLQSERDALIHLIGLYRAVGGGWPADMTAAGADSGVGSIASRPTERE